MARSTTRTTGDASSAGFSPAAGMLMGVALLAGCGIMALISQLGSADGAPTNASDAPVAQAVQRMTDHLDRVVEQQGEIARRMTDLELAMLGASSAREALPITGIGAPAELTEIRESMAQFASALESNDGRTQGPIVNQVIEAMSLIQEREEADREAQREQRRQERLDQVLLDLTDTLGLDANQQLSMKDLLAVAAKKRAELDDAGGSRNERRDSRDALRTDTEALAAGFLSPAQIQLLKEGGGLDVGGGRGGFPGDFGGGGGFGSGGRGR